MNLRSHPCPRRLLAVLVAAALTLSACASVPRDSSAPQAAKDYYGTLEPFAANAVYFVVTDRFVNGETGAKFNEVLCPAITPIRAEHKALG